jgi:hypothetical protein
MSALIKFDIVSPAYPLRPPRTYCRDGPGRCCHLGIGTGHAQVHLEPSPRKFSTILHVFAVRPCPLQLCPILHLYSKRTRITVTARTRDKQKFSLYGACASVELARVSGPNYGSLHCTLSCTATPRQHHYSTLGKYPRLSLVTSHKHNITSFLMRLR